MKKDKSSFSILENGHVKNLTNKKTGRPTIFVGSSKESLVIAEKLREFFPKDEFEFDLWSDGIFGRTISTSGTISNMGWLKNFTDIYDFSIFIFVPEDKIVSSTRMDAQGNSPKQANVTRHNVIFEYGMFLGRIGSKRSFILYDNDVQDFIDLFFTDLKEDLKSDTLNLEIEEGFRIETYNYKGNYAAYLEDNSVLPYNNESIEKAANEIKKQIIRNFEDAEISFLPATVLAFGYFNNFVNIFISNINILKSDSPYPPHWLTQKVGMDKLNNLRIIIQQAKEIRLKVIIPTSLEWTKQDNFKQEFDESKFDEVVFPGEHRSMTLLQHRHSSFGDNGRWVIYDVPTTLNSSIEAIHEITQYPDVQELLKEKELRNFRKSIKKKFDKSEFAKEKNSVSKYVELITYEQFMEETKS